MIRICTFSDTHGHHRDVKLPQNVDILIFCGDAMTTGYNMEELVDFFNWFSQQKAKYRIMIAGNHCRAFEDHSLFVRSLLFDYPEIIYLQDSEVNIEGIKFYGTPHTKKFFGWAFNRERDELEAMFSLIPDDVDVLVSHGAPFGTGDMLENGQRVGEEPLADRIKQLKNLKYHLFGHIHCGYGIYPKEQGYTAINASVVDEGYNVKNLPVTFEIC